MHVRFFYDIWVIDLCFINYIWAVINIPNNIVVCLYVCRYVHVLEMMIYYIGFNSFIQIARFQKLSTPCSKCICVYMI